MSDIAMTADKCANCGYPRKEHSYNGACYGLCGEFVPPTADANSPWMLAGRLRDLANGPIDEHLAELLHEIADGVSALQHKSGDDNDYLDGIVGRFIHASDMARDKFVDEMRAENKRLRDLAGALIADQRNET